MKPRVYIDNSVISYLTAKVGRDAVVVARQIVTIEWWAKAFEHYELVVSDFVYEEARGGNPEAAQRRLEAIKDLPNVDIDDPEIENLAKALTDRKALPATARFDALHIAAAACNGVELLITWNYKHLANPVQLDFVERVCADAGYQAPRIVTPDQLTLDNEGDTDVG